jgi:hypothetical protein
MSGRLRARSIRRSVRPCRSGRKSVRRDQRVRRLLDEHRGRVFWDALKTGPVKYGKVGKINAIFGLSLPTVSAIHWFSHAVCLVRIGWLITPRKFRFIARQHGEVHHRF